MLLVLVLTALGAMLLVPGLSYRYYVNGQLKNSSVDRVKTLLLPSQVEKNFQARESVKLGIWKSYPVLDKELELPINHPEGILFPDWERPGHFSFTDWDGNTLINISLGKVAKFDFKFNQTGIFALPLFEERLVHKLRENLVVWKDLFFLNVREEAKTIEESLYQLYILDLRKRFFREDFLQFSVISDNVYELIYKDGHSEIFSLQKEGLYLHSYLKINEADPRARRLYHNLKITNFVKLSLDEVTAEHLYQKFIELPFYEKKGRNGFYLLTLAWIYSKDQKYLNEIVKFMERGAAQWPLLLPLYEFIERTKGEDYLKSLVWTNETQKDKDRELTPLEIEALEADEKIKYLLDQAKKLRKAN